MDRRRALHLLAGGLGSCFGTIASGAHGGDEPRGKAAEDPGSPADLPGTRTLEATVGWEMASVLALSPDGRLVAAGGQRTESFGMVKVWDAVTGEPIATWPGHRPDKVYALAFSPDSRRLATAGPFGRVPDKSIFYYGAHFKCGEVKFWEAATGRLLQSIKPPTVPQLLAFSPEGERIATSGPQQGLSAWEINNSRRLCALGVRKPYYLNDDSTGISPGWRAAISPGLRRAVNRGGGPSKLKELPPGQFYWPEGTVPRPKGTPGIYLTLLDAETDRERVLEVSKKLGNRLGPFAFTPDGMRIVMNRSAPGRGKVLSVVDFETLEVVRDLELSARELVPQGFLAVSPDGKLVVMAAWESPKRERTFLQIWSLATGRLLQETPGSGRYVRTMAFPPGLIRVASGGYTHSLDPEPIQVWEVPQPDLP